MKKYYEKDLKLGADLLIAMEGRQYYSIRTGKNIGAIKLDLSMLKKLFIASYSSFKDKGYFQEAFGYTCVDAGKVDGSVGNDIEVYFIRKLRKTNLWPIEERLSAYSEDDLFDIIELLHDVISKPLEGRYHDWNGCGYHYFKFNKEEGQKEFRVEVNNILQDYKDGYELSSKGELLVKVEVGFEELYEEKLPAFDPENVDKKLERAVLKFRSHRSSPEQKNEAVRELADILEFLRPRLARVILTKDEGDLFSIANNFTIRHNNQRQKSDYNKDIWLNWIFNIYLATIHMVIKTLSTNQS